MSEQAELLSCDVEGVDDLLFPSYPSPMAFLKNLSSESVDFVKAISDMGVLWRYPYYMEWMRRKSFLRETGAACNPALSVLRSWFSKPLRSFAKASFIEWRYYSLISKDFHGILGVCLFNPERRLSLLAEGGLLVIVAGASPGNAAVCDSQLSPADMCWMKMFPAETLRIVESQGARLECSHDGVQFEVENSKSGASRVRLSGEKNPHLDLVLTPFKDSGLSPVMGHDVSGFPGAHWTVHNMAPMATISGVLSMSNDFVENLPLKGVSYPDFVSDPRSFVRHLSLDGVGYYEHSYGMNPMPFHGWDFFFVPNPKDGNSLVMQTYQNSSELRYVDVHWTENGRLRHLRFEGSELSVIWEKKHRSREMKMLVPEERVVRAESGGYSLEVRNRVSRRIPFLRQKKFFVRHYYISEEIGTTSWVLRDSRGAVLCEVVDMPSGGETASRRIFV
jgi:hypothetical protein